MKICEIFQLKSKHKYAHQSSHMVTACNQKQTKNQKNKIIESFLDKKKINRDFITHHIDVAANCETLS